MLSGIGDQVAPGLGEIASAVPHILNPNLDFQNAFQAQIISHPEVIQKYADIDANDPTGQALVRAGLNKNQIAYIRSQPRSLNSTLEKAGTNLVTPGNTEFDSQARVEAASKASGAETPIQRSTAQAELEGKKIQNQLGQLGIDKDTAEKPYWQAIAEGKASEAHAITDQYIKQVADKKTYDNVLNRIGGKDNLYSIVSGKAPLPAGAAPITPEEADVIRESPTYKTQRQEIFDKQLTNAAATEDALKKQQIAESKSRQSLDAAKAARDVNGNIRDVAANASAITAKVRAEQLIEVNPPPSNIGITDIIHAMMDPSVASTRPDVLKWIDDSNKLAPPSKVIQKQLDSYEKAVAPELKKMNDANPNTTDTQRKQAADNANAITRQFPAVIFDGKIPVYGGKKQGESYSILGYSISGAKTGYGRIDQYATENDPQEQQIKSLLTALKDDPNPEATIDAAKTLTPEMKDELKKRLKGQK